MRTWTLLFVAACLVACSRKKETIIEEPAPPAKQEEFDPVASWSQDDILTVSEAKEGLRMLALRRNDHAPWKYDADAIASKLDGAWYLHDVAAPGDHQAWSFQARSWQLTIYDGTAETSYDFAVDAPCQLTATRTNAFAEPWMTVHHFAFDGDVLHLGLGDAGVQTGSQIVGCTWSGVYLYDGKGCKLYQATPQIWSPWSMKDATCALGGGKLTADDEALTFAGTVLLDDHLRGNIAERARDFADAKARVDAQKK
jgi:hypothetical protein